MTTNPSRPRQVMDLNALKQPKTAKEAKDLWMAWHDEAHAEQRRVAAMAGMMLVMATMMVMIGVDALFPDLHIWSDLTKLLK